MLWIVSCLIGRAQSAAYFSKAWVLGGPMAYSTTFNGSTIVNAFIDTLKYPRFDGGHSNICDSLGNVVICSNGYNLFDKNLNYIDGGDTLVPKMLYQQYFGWSVLSQSSIILPFPNRKYYFVTPTASDTMVINNWNGGPNPALFDLLLYNVVDMNANNGAGKVTRRMVPLLQGVLLSKTQMMACKHGNGVDWWLLKHASVEHKIYKFLFRQDTVQGPFIQTFTPDIFITSDNGGQSVFSRDGTLFATTNRGAGKIFLAEFDRCTGVLSNPKIINVPVEKTHNPFDTTETEPITEGLAFSPNGRFLYVSKFYNVQQYDLQDPNPAAAWVTVAGVDTTWQAFQLYSSMYLGPDDKLYIGNWNGFSSAMSVINNPNSKGAACNFCPKCLRYPVYHHNGNDYSGVSQPPCMPNYALGPVNRINCWPEEVTPVAPKPAFRLYPNPSNGLITVEYATSGTVVITDMTGRPVRTLTLSEGKGKERIDLSTMPPGIYLYRYLVKGAVQASGKLSIVR